MKQIFSNTHLLLITNSFPFGVGEAFLESEVPILAEKFEKITILPTHSSSGKTRSIPSNVEFKTIPEIDPRNILGNLLQFCDSIFWRELLLIKKRYRLSPTLLVIKQLLSSLYVSKRLSKAIETLIIPSEAKTIAYSYWANEGAQGLALLKKRQPRINAVTRTHGWDVYFERRNTGFIPYRSLLFRHLDAVFFISQHGLDYTANKFPEHAAFFRLSRLGTLQREWIPKLAKPTPLHVVSVSNLILLKRVNLIIEALGKLNIPIKWTHFGEGPERGKLEKCAQEVLEEKANISWAFEGQVSNTAILAFYRKQQPHVFINTSTTEGLPVSIMEAMAHSIPVIATDVGGTPEIVRDSKNGFLLPANLSANQLANQIEDFYNLDIEYMNAMRQSAYKTWSEHFNAELNFKLFAMQLLQL